MQLLDTDSIDVYQYRPIVRRPDGSWDVSAATVTIPLVSVDTFDVSCASKSFCMMVGRTTYQMWNGSTWSAPKSFSRYGSFGKDVSCVTASMCLMVTGYGDVYRWNGHSWSGPHQLAGGARPSAIGCPTTTSCTVLTEHGALRWNGTKWGRLTVFDPNDPKNAYDFLTDVSCPTTTFCEAVDSLGYAFTYTARSGWGGRHKISQRNTRIPMQVSCSGADFCVAITGQGDAIHRVGRIWQTARAADPASGGYPHVGCDSPVLCVVVDLNGAATVFNGTSWTKPHPVDSSTPRFDDISCSGGSFCMAAGQSGRVYTRTHGAWSRSIVVRDADDPAYTPTDGLSSISCGTPTLCATTSEFDAYVFVWDGSKFHQPLFADDNDSIEAACGIDGCVMDYYDSGDRSSLATWVYHADGTLHQFAGSKYGDRLSCVTVSFCLSGEEMFDGSQWTDVPNHGPFGVQSISCATTTFCVAVAGRSATTWDGTSWSAPQEVVPPNLTGFTGLDSVSCKRAICVATDPYGWAVVATANQS